MEAATAYAAVFFTRKQTGRFQYAEVLRNRRQGNAGRIGEVGHTTLPLRQLREYGAPRRIRQSGKRTIKRATIINHMVNITAQEESASRGKMASRKREPEFGDPDWPDASKAQVLVCVRRPIYEGARAWYALRAEGDETHALKS